MNVLLGMLNATLVQHVSAERDVKSTSSRDFLLTCGTRTDTHEKMTKAVELKKRPVVMWLIGVGSLTMEFSFMNLDNAGAACPSFDVVARTKRKGNFIRLQ